MVELMEKFRRLRQQVQEETSDSGRPTRWFGDLSKAPIPKPERDRILAFTRELGLGNCRVDVREVDSTWCPPPESSVDDSVMMAQCGILEALDLEGLDGPGLLAASGTDAGTARIALYWLFECGSVVLDGNVVRRTDRVL